MRKNQYLQCKLETYSVRTKFFNFLWKNKIWQKEFIYIGFKTIKV